MHTGAMTFAGQGGSDLIDLTWQGNQNVAADMILFGDWGYGAEDSRYAGTQYGDTRLEKKLWGGADTILAGYGKSGNTLSIYAGDGDDYVETEYGHKTMNIYGGRGNDTIKWGGAAEVAAAGAAHTINGGLGDDLIEASKYGDNMNIGESDGIANGLGTMGLTLTINGGEGNDRVGLFPGNGG